MNAQCTIVHTLHSHWSVYTDERVWVCLPVVFSPFWTRITQFFPVVVMGSAASALANIGKSSTCHSGEETTMRQEKKGKYYRSVSWSGYGLRCCQVQLQNHWNIEVKYGVRSPKFNYLGSMCTAVLIGGDPATPPPSPPAFGLIYEGAIGQPRWTTSLCDLLHWTLTSKWKNKKNLSWRKFVAPVLCIQMSSVN